MKGYIPIEIPTKRYIKAFIIHKLGEKPVMNTRTKIGAKFYHLLHNKKNEDKKKFSNKRYNTTLRVYISQHVFRHRGPNLHETNVRDFNIFVENTIKEQFYFIMDFYIDVLPNFTTNLPIVRKKLGITLDDWDDESMRKDYYRYRLDEGKPLLYDKKHAAVVPSSKKTKKGL